MKDIFGAGESMLWLGLQTQWEWGVEQENLAFRPPPVRDPKGRTKLLELADDGKRRTWFVVKDLSVKREVLVRGAPGSWGAEKVRSISRRRRRDGLRWSLQTRRRCQKSVLRLWPLQMLSHSETVVGVTCMEPPLGIAQRTWFSHCCILESLGSYYKSPCLGYNSNRSESL